MIEKYHNLEPDIKRTLIMSLVFHASVILVFTVKTTFFPSDIPKYEPAVRVDLVGLPEKRNPDKPLAPAAPTPVAEPAKETPKPQEKKPEEKKVETKPSKTAKTSQSDALNKLKAQSAIDKLKNLKEEKPTPATDAKPQADTVKGNVIQAGTALKGLSKIEFDQYIGSLDAHIKNNWALPEWMVAQGLQAEVSIKIDKSGHVIERKITKKSGNAEFDNYALAAIEKSNPFPPPPEKFTDLVGIQGITFAFP